MTKHFYCGFIQGVIESCALSEGVTRSGLKKYIEDGLGYLCCADYARQALNGLEYLPKIDESECYEGFREWLEEIKESPLDQESLNCLKKICTYKCPDMT